MGRSRKIWGDDINEFLKPVEKEIENMTRAATNSIKLASTHQKTAEDRDMKNNKRTRGNSQNIPSRNVNGVKLSDEDLVDTT